jgi:hypothetical protein
MKLWKQNGVKGLDRSIVSDLTTRTNTRMILSSIQKSDKSRMTGDCHVRFCESLGVKLPLATRTIKVPRDPGNPVNPGQSFGIEQKNSLSVHIFSKIA